MITTVVSQLPVPLVAIEHDSMEAMRDSEILKAVQGMLGKIGNVILRPGYRAVGLDRLQYVLERGVDVDPIDAVIWVNFLDKALEYGGTEKLVLVFDPKQLDTTFREVRAGSPPEELAVLSMRYPTKLTSEDGEMCWFSRLSATDKPITSAHEVDSARWIPTDPWVALRLLLVVGPAGVGLVERARRALNGSRRVGTD